MRRGKWEAGRGMREAGGRRQEAGGRRQEARRGKRETRLSPNRTISSRCLAGTSAAHTKRACMLRGCCLVSKREATEAIAIRAEDDVCRPTGSPTTTVVLKESPDFTSRPRPSSEQPSSPSCHCRSRSGRRSFDRPNPATRELPQHRTRPALSQQDQRSELLARTLDAPAVVNRWTYTRHAKST